MLMRTLQDGNTVEPDLFHHEALPGDRYLVCSDGVTAVLGDDEILEVLASEDEPQAVVDRLIALSNEGGGPDNITCVVADVVDGEEPVSDAGPELVRAAAVAPPD